MRIVHRIEGRAGYFMSPVLNACLPESRSLTNVDTRTEEDFLEVGGWRGHPDPFQGQVGFGVSGLA